MFKDPLHWFPNLLYSNLLAALFVGSYLVDTIVPRITAANAKSRGGKDQDRGSFLIIQAAALLAVGAAVVGRYLNLWVITGLFQWLGLVIGFFGIIFREWAVITLGKSFARVVRIEPEQRLITGGPYRWIRHPAYTGMLLVYVGLGMALGSVVGTITASLCMLGATMYRIRVEEAALHREFGQQYVEYSSSRWMLFPGW